MIIKYPFNIFILFIFQLILYNKFLLRLCNGLRFITCNYFGYYFSWSFYTDTVDGLLGFVVVEIVIIKVYRPATYVDGLSNTVS